MDEQQYIDQELNALGDWMDDRDALFSKTVDQLAAILVADLRHQRITRGASKRDALIEVNLHLKNFCTELRIATDAALTKITA